MSVRFQLSVASVLPGIRAMLREPVPVEPPAVPHRTWFDAGKGGLHDGM